MGQIFKKITDRSEQELDDGIKQAILACTEAGLDFYRVLTGIDSYFEKRRRKCLKDAK